MDYVVTMESGLMFKVVIPDFKEFEKLLRDCATNETNIIIKDYYINPTLIEAIVPLNTLLREYDE